MLDLLKDCCNCFLLPLVKKHLNEHIMYHDFSFLIEKSFGNLSNLLHNLIQLSLLNSFLFLSRFSVSLKSLINFRRFACKSLLNRFSVLINYIMSSSNHFSTSSCFPGFSGSGSRFQKQRSAFSFRFALIFVLILIAIFCINLFISISRV